MSLAWAWPVTPAPFPRCAACGFHESAIVGVANLRCAQCGEKAIVTSEESEARYDRERTADEGKMIGRRYA